MTFGTWRWWGCQPQVTVAFTPRKCSWYSFLLGAESTPGPWYGRKEYVTEKSTLYKVLIRIFRPKKIVESEKCIIGFTIHTLNVNSDNYIKNTPVGLWHVWGRGEEEEVLTQVFGRNISKWNGHLAKKKKTNVIKKDLGHAWCEISDNRMKCLGAWWRRWWHSSAQR